MITTRITTEGVMSFAAIAESDPNGNPCGWSMIANPRMATPLIRFRVTGPTGFVAITLTPAELAELGAQAHAYGTLLADPTPAEPSDHPRLFEPSPQARSYPFTGAARFESYGTGE